MPARKYRMIGGALGAAFSGGAAASLDVGTMLVTVLVVLAVAAIAIFFAKHSGYLSPQQAKPTVVIMERGASAAAATPLVQLNSDPRFAPMAPERSYGAPPDLRGFPSLPLPAGVGAMSVNRQTRGIPDSFQQIGVLTTAGGTANSGTPNRTILPLFGRSTDSGRDKWNYYTRTDGMNPVQVPVQFKRRNCDDDIGCDEILDGDSVGVPVMGQSFTANVYRYSTPRYLPV